MDDKIRKESLRRKDSDSGLDNSSESGHSGDEDTLAVLSDPEDLLVNDIGSSNFGESFSTPENAQSTEAGASNSTEQTDPTFLKNVNTAKDPLEENPSKCHVTIELNYNKKLIEEYKDVKDFYVKLAESQCETVDFSVTSSSDRPEWLDEEKFKRGQKFAREHLFCINFAEMLSLFILFAQKSSLDPLIFTGKSDSPFTAFKRYLSTLTKLMSWYQDDVWNETDSVGAKNLSTVRGMHKNVFQKLTNSTPEDLAQKTTLGNPETTAIWCPMRNVIKDDFREFLPLPPRELEEYMTCRKVWVNQADMSLTQFGFVGLAVTYPQYFGIHLASEEDLSAFLHLWRGLGYLLGIKDEYNYCNADLETVRRRTKFFIEMIAKPSFRDVTCDWEHMCRCVTAGIAYYLPLVNFESCLMYLCHILNINTPRLRKQMSFGSYIVYLIHKLTFYLMRFDRVFKFLQLRLCEIIRKVQNAPPEVLTAWENREFPYMKQPGKCPIRMSNQIAT